MKKELFAISSLALSCLALSACNTLDQIEREFTFGSENAQVEDATSKQKTAGRKSAAQRAPSSTKALEVKTKATGSDIKLDAHDETLAASSGNEKVTEAVDADEEAALRRLLRSQSFPIMQRPPGVKPAPFHTGPRPKPPHLLLRRSFCKS